MVVMSVLAVMTVSDTGPGIPAGVRDAMVEPFKRLELTQEGWEGHTGGFGLGLAIAKLLIQRQRGQMTLSGNCPKGLIVTLSLPKFATE